MVIHTLGLCAGQDEDVVLKAMPKAEEYLERESGACLWGPTIKCLGYVGAELEESVQRVFPRLEGALESIPRQTKSVLEGLLRIIDQTEGELRDQIGEYAQRYVEDERSSIRGSGLEVEEESVEGARLTGAWSRPILSACDCGSIWQPMGWRARVSRQPRIGGSRASRYAAAYWTRTVMR